METTIETNEYEHKGRTIKIELFYDEDHGTPWEDDDGRGIVSEWTTRDKAPGERILCEDRRSKRFFDFAGTVEKAKHDGWGIQNPPVGATRGQIAALAAEQEYEYLRRWCTDQWHYVGYIATIDGEDFDSCWGFESEYWDKDGREEVLDQARAQIDNEEFASFQEMAQS